jgi:hypothetical protein
MLTFNGLHDVISKEIVLFITTSVRTSNPTRLHKIANNAAEYSRYSHLEYVFRFLVVSFVDLMIWPPLPSSPGLQLATTLATSGLAL